MRRRDESLKKESQKLYCAPVIDEWWENMREELCAQFANEDLTVCGDGQCDSPGFSAKNLCC